MFKKRSLFILLLRYIKEGVNLIQRKMAAGGRRSRTTIHEPSLDVTDTQSGIKLRDSDSGFAHPFSSVLSQLSSSREIDFNQESANAKQELIELGIKKAVAEAFLVSLNKRTDLTPIQRIAEKTKAGTIIKLTDVLNNLYEEAANRHDAHAMQKIGIAAGILLVNSERCNLLRAEKYSTDLLIGNEIASYRVESCRKTYEKLRTAIAAVPKNLGIDFPPFETLKS